MKIYEILRPTNENASCGSTGAGSVAAIANPGRQPGEGEFFGGDPKASIYAPIKSHRKARKKVKEGRSYRIVRDDE